MSDTPEVKVIKANYAPKWTSMKHAEVPLGTEPGATVELFNGDGSKSYGLYRVAVVTNPAAGAKNADALVYAAVKPANKRAVNSAAATIDLLLKTQAEENAKRDAQMQAFMLQIAEKLGK